MQCDIGYTLALIEKLEIPGTKTGLVFKYCKLYDVDKMNKVYQRATAFRWWRNNTLAAFLKAIKEVNASEKAGV